ncbi:MAG TPA: hypothetical protein VF021_09775, partial [Longimicrobiales bacterium]
MSVGVAILGCTGSIGRSALAVLSRHRDQFHVVALAAHRNETLLREQVAATRAPFVALVEKTGRQGLLEAASHPDVDIVINA